MGIILYRYPTLNEMVDEMFPALIGNFNPFESEEPEGERDFSRFTDKLRKRDRVKKKAKTVFNKFRRSNRREEN